MDILHIQLLKQFSVEDSWTLRYFVNSPFNYNDRSVSAKGIEDLIHESKRDYYSPLPENLSTIGQRLYRWLDGPGRWLANAIQRFPSGIPGVLAISTDDRNLTHLPWELLHDGHNFLVNGNPKIVPVRWLAVTNQPRPTKNGPLQILFMATSPSGVPFLNYEAEEAEILKETERPPLSLIVEDTGCLEELKNFVTQYDNKEFDVLHLTGHATHIDGVGHFLTEDKEGNRVNSSAEDIRNTLENRLPPLVFLSGCHTGEAGDFGALPSMAEKLVDFGVNVVLSWGREVSARDATAAAAALYKSLAQGDNLIEAVARTYRILIEEKQVQDWHLLRIYVGGQEKVKIPDSLVTKLMTPGRSRGVYRSRGMLKGRRRELIECLQSLKPHQALEEIVGVLIYEIDAIDDSERGNLANRLKDRLSAVKYQCIELKDKLSETNLIRGLEEKVQKEQRDSLNSLKKRLSEPDGSGQLQLGLRDIFKDMGEPLLIKLDNFHQNVDESSRLMHDVAKVFRNLVWAIKDSNTNYYTAHRLVITSCKEIDPQTPELQDLKMVELRIPQSAGTVNSPSPQL